MSGSLIPRICANEIIQKNNPVVDSFAEITLVLLHMCNMCALHPHNLNHDTDN